LAGTVKTTSHVDSTNHLSVHTVTLCKICSKKTEYKFIFPCFTAYKHLWNVWTISQWLVWCKSDVMCMVDSNQGLTRHNKCFLSEGTKLAMSILLKLWTRIS